MEVSRKTSHSTAVLQAVNLDFDINAIFRKDARGCTEGC